MSELVGSIQMLFVETLDMLGIGACGLKATEAGYLMKVFTSCLPDQTAYDLLYNKERSFVLPSTSSIQRDTSLVPSPHCSPLVQLTSSLHGHVQSLLATTSNTS